MNERQAMALGIIRCQTRPLSLVHIILVKYDEFMIWN